MPSGRKNAETFTPANGESHEDAHELEIKFRTDSSGLQQAKIFICGDKAGELPALKLRSRYFDTPSGSLRKAGVGLRLRSGEGKGDVQTVKSVGAAHGGPFLRREAEAQAVGDTPDISLFDKKSAMFLAKLIRDERLAVQAETAIRRESLMVNAGVSQVEISFDDGFAKAGDPTLDIKEIELELKSGPAEDLYALAIRLAESLPLRLDFSSKAAKAFGLMTDEKQTAFKASPVHLDRSMNLADLISAILTSTLEHFAANWPVFRQVGQAESIHQLRVALRRMRSALAFFERELDGEVFESLREKAKYIATALGRVREIDVFRENVERLSGRKSTESLDMNALLAALDDLRKHTFQNASNVMEEAQTTVFALEIQRIASGYGQYCASDVKQAIDVPAIDFAGRTLDHLHKRVLNRGRHFEKMDADQRHELRIAFKNLRYAADFFSGLYSGNRRIKAYLDCLAAIQNIMGAQNDAVMAAQFLEAHLTGFTDAERLAAMAVVKAQAVKKAFGERALIKRWRDFKEAEIFWS